MNAHKKHIKKQEELSRFQDTFQENTVKESWNWRQDENKT